MVTPPVKTPVGTSNTIIPAVKNALAPKACALVSPASSKKERADAPDKRRCQRMEQEQEELNVIERQWRWPTKRSTDARRFDLIDPAWRNAEIDDVYPS